MNFVCRRRYQVLAVGTCILICLLELDLCRVTCHAYQLMVLYDYGFYDEQYTEYAN